MCVYTTYIFQIFYNICWLIVFILDSARMEREIWDTGGSDITITTVGGGISAMGGGEDPDVATDKSI